MYIAGVLFVFGHRFSHSPCCCYPTDVSKGEHELLLFLPLPVFVITGITSVNDLAMGFILKIFNILIGLRIQKGGWVSKGENMKE